MNRYEQWLHEHPDQAPPEPTDDEMEAFAQKRPTATLESLSDMFRRLYPPRPMRRMRNVFYELFHERLPVSRGDPHAFDPPEPPPTPPPEPTSTPESRAEAAIRNTFNPSEWTITRRTRYAPPVRLTRAQIQASRAPRRWHRMR